MPLVREASEDDRGAIYEVHVAAVQGVTSSTYSDVELAIWEATLSPDMYSLDRPDGLFLVVERKSEIVGFVEASVTDPEIDKLYVDPRCQRNGVATLLVEEIEYRIRGHEESSLYVEASLNAVPFYESVGFEQTGTLDKTITHEDTTIVMTVADMQKNFR